VVKVGDDLLFEDEVMTGNKGGEEISGVEKSEDEEELVVELSVEFPELDNAGILIEVLVDQLSDGGQFLAVADE
jgi:hypothetical protein